MCILTAFETFLIAAIISTPATRIITFEGFNKYEANNICSYETFTKGN